MFRRLPWLPAVWHEPFAEGERVEFTTHDGICLGGTYLSAATTDRQGVVLYCHELNGDRSSARTCADQLRQRGFDLFSFDFRSHGSSDRTPGFEPTPWVTSEDVADVKAAIDYLANRPDADPRGIGLVGLGKGAAAAICATAGDVRVRAVVAEGLYPTRPLKAQLIGRFSRFPWLFAVADRLARVADAWAVFVLGCRRGHRFLDVETLACRNDRPILMIHAQFDRFVPIAWIRLLHRKMARGSNLWIVRGAKHAEAPVAAGQQYGATVARFFHRHWEATPSTAEQPAAFSSGQSFKSALSQVVASSATSLPST